LDCYDNYLVLERPGIKTKQVSAKYLIFIFTVVMKMCYSRYRSSCCVQTNGNLPS